VAFGLILALCGSAVAKEPDVTLHLWHIPDKGRGDPISASRRRVFDDFCRQNPDIKVKALVPLKIEGPAAWGNEFLAVAGGVAPDVFLLPSEKVGDYREQELLYPLNEFIQKFADERGRPYRGVNALDQVWEVCHYNGTIDCVPYNEYFQAIYCRMDQFARVGLPLRGPQNWDELYTMARRLRYDPLKEPGGSPSEPRVYGMRVLAGLIAGWNYLTYVWTSGGEIVQGYYPLDGELIPVPSPPVDFREFGIEVSNQEAYDRLRAERIKEIVRLGVPVDYSNNDLQWRLVTNTPEAMKAFEFQRRLVHQPWIRNRGAEFDITPEMIKARRAVDPKTGDEFDLDDKAVQDRIYHGVSRALEYHSETTAHRDRDVEAMWMGTLQDKPWALKGQFVVPFPSRKGAPPAAFVAGEMMAINAAIVTSDDPGRGDVDKIREAAWKYVEYMSGPEAQQTKMETFVEHGLEQFVKPTILREGGYEHIVERIPPRLRKVWTHYASSARAQPYMKGFKNVTGRELSLPLTSMITDQPDPVTGKFEHNLQELMDAACFRVNKFVLGKMPESEIRRRAKIGWVIFVIMGVGVAVAAWAVVKLAIRMQAKARDMEGFGVGGHPARRRIMAWALLLPAVGTILIWSYYPLVKGLVVAFQDYKLVGESRYVGLRNFIEAVNEPEFWKYIYQTFKYMGLLVGIGFCVPIALALLLHEIPRGKVLYRVIYYLPAVTTGLVTLFLWKNLLYHPSATGVINRMIVSFNDLPTVAACALKISVLAAALLIAYGLFGQAALSTNTPRHRWAAGGFGGAIILAVAWVVGPWIGEAGPAGLINGLASRFEFKAQQFLFDPDLAMVWCVLPPIWAAAGPACLIYLAALKGIPEEQYEAADIDGAGVWNKLWNVTIPNLKALIIINFVGAVIAGFKEASNIFVMTGGGPKDSTMTIGLQIWYNAYIYLNFGRATAMAWIMGALLIGFTLNQLRILNKLQFRSAAVEAEVRGAQGG
jgi:ABC-type sugar transport system permease subunit